ncbi:5493_t:CDS:2 [Acaulospora colombiana]|uniref:5493_t:CDS:1 n=1 Tax=Acaulospora colombiana TaxID=27376 RepID=A0ACA9L6Q6_9GLOM|nr:5493_t:CDS:2 [Acaulospora colombiana]
MFQLLRQSGASSNSSFTIATSFEYLQIVNGMLFKIFKEAYKTRGLLEDNNKWSLALEEASL